MTTQRRIVCLVLLAGLALGLRVWVTVGLSDGEAALVAPEQGRIAENLLAGRGFSGEFLGADGPTSQQAPFYPLLLASGYVLFGVGSASAVVAVQLLQCVAGTALVLAVVWLAWSLMPTRPVLGCIAGLGAAVYPAHVSMVVDLDVAVWAALLLTLLLAVVASPRLRATRRGAIAAGAISGVLLLVEPVLVLALPVCLLFFWLHEDRLWTRAALARVGLVAGLTAVVILPWLLRGWLVHGEPVFIKSTFGHAFWQANNPTLLDADEVPGPIASAATPALPATPDHNRRPVHDRDMARHARRDMRLIDSVALTPDDCRQLGQLSEPERSRVLGRLAWRFVRDNRAQYAQLCVQRLGRFMLFDETDPRTGNRVSRAGTVVWLVLVFVGVLVSRGQWRTFWPLFAVFLALTLFHVLTIASARFRIPIEPLSFLLAASAVYPLVERTIARPLRIYRPGECPHDPFGADHALRGPHFGLPKNRARQRRRAG